MKKYIGSLIILFLLNSLVACDLTPWANTMQISQNKTIQKEIKSEVKPLKEDVEQKRPQEDWGNLDRATQKLITERKIKDVIFREKKSSEPYEITAYYPQLVDITNKQVEEKINTEIQKFALAKIKDFQETYGKDNFHSTFFMDYDISLLNDHIFSFQMYGSYFDESMAHPNTELFSMNYDLANGNVIHLADLFKKNIPYLKLISDYCIKELKDEIKNDIQPDYETVPDTFKWIEEGAGPKEENFSHFSLSQNALIIDFDFYQVGPYVIGQPSVAIPYSKIKSSLLPAILTKTES